MRELLRTLALDLNNAPFSAHITVVDNGSGDRVGDMLESEFSTVFFMQTGVNCGYAKAVNIGIRAKAAEYYFVLNPDVRIIQPQTLERLWRFMQENPKVGMCSPKQFNLDGSLQHTCHRLGSALTPFYRRTRLGVTNAGRQDLGQFMMHDWNHANNRLVEWVQGSAMFVRAEAVKTVGLMDERFFFYFEDTDWCRRFWGAGWPIYYVAAVAIQHEHRRTSASMSVWRGLVLNNTTRWHVMSWLKYLIKYRGQQL